MTYDEIKDLCTLADYFKGLEILSMKELQRTANEDPSNDDPQVLLGHLTMCLGYVITIRAFEGYKQHSK